jgi:hypothetical protein
MWRWCVILVAISGCTGLSLGENEPGGDTWVEPPPPKTGEHRMGALAVERDEDQLWVVHTENRDGFTREHLSAIEAGTGATHEVLDVTGTSDRRVVFPAPNRMILMAQRNDQDQLVLLDTTTRTVLAQTIKPTWYWGTRTAPSGHSLVVADNDDPLAPLHVIDTATLAHQVVPHGGDAIEAMWDHNSDVLFALSVSDPFGPAATATILRFDISDPTAPLTPTRTWQLPGYGWDYWFSFTWITISPDDHWALFPLIDRRESEPTFGQHVLCVLDQTTGTTAIVDGSGPAGFTRDSKTIVSYAASSLWLIDPVTHTRKVVDMPFQGGINFFPARDADYIVVSGVRTAVYDIAKDRVDLLTNATAIGLDDFISRRGTAELWLHEAGLGSLATPVYTLDLAAATLTPVSSQLATTLNVRPSADEAVIGDGTTATIQRISMTTRTQVGAVVQLPSPIDIPAAAGSIAIRRSSHDAARIAQSPFDPAYDPQAFAAVRGAR